jgi:hypothetical protein
VSLGCELVFPLLGTLASDQAMFRFDQAIVAGGPFRLISRPLQALVPEPVKVPPLLLEARRRLQRQSQGSRFERGENPLTDDGIDGFTGEILAIISPLVGRHAMTGGAMPLAWTSIAHL